MNVEEMEKEIKALRKRITIMEDIEEIKKIQYKYFYFVDHCMWDDLIDLFSEDCVLELSDSGVYLGKEGLARQFKGRLATKKLMVGSGYMGKITGCDPIVDIMTDGKTATAGFDNLTFIAYPHLDRSEWANGRYETEFIKEDGKWKICKLHYQSRFRTPFDGKGWHETSRTATLQDPSFPPDRHTTIYAPNPGKYPSHNFPKPFTWSPPKKSDSKE